MWRLSATAILGYPVRAALHGLFHGNVDESRMAQSLEEEMTREKHIAALSALLRRAYAVMTGSTVLVEDRARLLQEIEYALNLDPQYHDGQTVTLKMVRGFDEEANLFVKRYWAEGHGPAASSVEEKVTLEDDMAWNLNKMGFFSMIVDENGNWL